MNEKREYRIFTKYYTITGFINHILIPFIIIIIINFRPKGVQNESPASMDKSKDRLSVSSTEFIKNYIVELIWFTKSQLVSASSGSGQNLRYSRAYVWETFFIGRTRFSRSVPSGNRLSAAARSGGSGEWWISLARMILLCLLVLSVLSTFFGRVEVLGTSYFYIQLWFI